MRQIRITKRRHRADGGRQAPLTHDPRDPDIVRAHEAARRLARSRAGRARPAGRVRTKPAHGDR
jgi:hypothetical protein